MTWSQKPKDDIEQTAAEPAFGERTLEVEGQVELPAGFGAPEVELPPVSAPIATAAAILRVTGIAFTIFPNGVLLALAISRGIDGSTLFLLILALLPAMFLRCEASDLLHRVPTARRRAGITLLWVSAIELALLALAVRMFNAFLSGQRFTVQGLTNTTDRISPVIPLGFFLLIIVVLALWVRNLLAQPDPVPAPAEAPTEPPPTE